MRDHGNRGRFSVRHVDRLGAPTGGGLRSTRAMQGGCAVLVCALLVSCGGEARLVPPGGLSSTPTSGVPGASPVATPGTNPSDSSTPAIGEIVWVAMSDPVTNAPVDVVPSYSPEAPRITASALVTALSAGAIVAATWEYNDTSLDAFSRQIVLSAATDQIWISFHIDRESETAWPAGAYEVAISLDGTVVQRAVVDVAIQE